MSAAEPPRLIAIVDSERASADVWRARLEPRLAAARAGSVLVMLRDRQLPARERRGLGELLRQLTHSTGQLLCVNDRLDLAVLLEADAVHLAESSVEVADVRAFARRYRKRWLVSSASHDPGDAAWTPADALLISPVAEARKGRLPMGLAGLRSARSALQRRPSELGRCLLYALGGVSAENAASLLGAGADGVAMIGALLEAGATSSLVEALALAR